MPTIFSKNNKDELNKLNTFNSSPTPKNPTKDDTVETQKFSQGTNNTNPLKSSDMEKGPLSLIPGAKTAFSGLPPELRNNILKSNGYNEIKTSILLGEGINETVDRIIKIGNLSTIQQLALLTKAVSGCDFPINVIDINGLSRLGANIIMESCKFGLFDSYYAFIKCLNENVFKGNSRKKISQNINKFLTGFVISTGTLQLLSQMGKFGFASDIIKYRPNIMGEFIGRYGLPYNTPVGQFKQISYETLNIYNQFKPNWFKKNNYYYLTPLFKSSNDFKKTLSVASNSVKIIEVDSNKQIIINNNGIVNKTLPEIDKVISLTSIMKYSTNKNHLISTEQFFKKTYPTIAFK